MKTIATMVVGLLLIPSATFAATPEEQYQGLVSQLIALLTEQVQVLQAQLAALQEQKTSPQVVSQETSLGAIIQPKSMLKVSGESKINGEVVEVSGSLSADAELTAYLTESMLDTSGQTPKYSDPEDKGVVQVQREGNNFSFSFPYTPVNTGNGFAAKINHVRLEATYEGNIGYAIATGGQNFSFFVKP